jgi:hypothetical protein
MPRHDTIMIQVVLYEHEVFSEVGSLARQFDEDAAHRGFCCLSVKVAPGSRVGVHLSSRSFVIEDPVQWTIWNGQPAVVQFAARVDPTPSGSTGVFTFCSPLLAFQSEASNSR